MERTRGKMVAGGPGKAVVGGPGRINQEEQLGSETDHTTQGSSTRKESLKTSGYKDLWGLGWQKKLPASQKSSLERPMGS